MGRTNQTDGNKPEKVKKAKKSAEADKKAPTEEAKIKKPHRFHSGTVALRQIRQYQKTTDFLMRKGPLQRIIREKLAALSEKRALAWTDKTKPCLPLRIRKGCLPLLQEATERYIVELYEDAYKTSLHAKRITLMDRDIDLLQSIINRTKTNAFARTPIPKAVAGAF